MKFDYEYLNFYPAIKSADLDIIKDFKYYRAFNVGILRYEDKFLYSVRVRLQSQMSEDGSNTLIPGNLPGCIYSIGSNFWWNRWKSGQDITLFFIGDHRKDEYTHLEIIGDIPLRLGGDDNSRSIQYLTDADYRITFLNEIYVIHSSNLGFMFFISKIEDNKMYLSYSKGPNTYGKNQQLLSIQDKNYYVKYLDWYTKEGVHIIYGDNFYGTDVVNIFIRYNINYGLYGEGSFDIERSNNPPPRIVRNTSRLYPYEIKQLSSIVDPNNIIENKILFGHNYGIMPKFSFSTPLLNINNNTKLGVGHIKIYSDENKYPYIEGSNIQKFRSQLYEYMERNFGNKYIKHFGTTSPPDCTGYIYMMYFYLLFEKDDNYEMLLSDSYLPLYLGYKTPDTQYDLSYKFSLIFPIGLEKLNYNDIIVTCGEGDFYAVALIFNLQEVINSCVHNVKKLNLQLYEYNLLITDKIKDNNSFCY